MEKNKSMTNPWMEHVKKERAKAKNKGKSYKAVLIAAKATYKGKSSTNAKKKCRKKAEKECAKKSKK